jgi:hypothetical protein
MKTRGPNMGGNPPDLQRTSHTHIVVTMRYVRPASVSRFGTETQRLWLTIIERAVPMRRCQAPVLRTRVAMGMLASLN